MNPVLRISDHLLQRAADAPEQTALIAGADRLTFRELEDQSSVCARGLRSIGIQPGERAVLMVRPGPEFLVLSFGLIKLGAVPVFVDPGMGRSNLGKCLEEADPGCFIGIRRAHMARLVLGWARRSLKHWITVGRGPTVGWEFF